MALGTSQSAPAPAPARSLTKASPDLSAAPAAFTALDSGPGVAAARSLDLISHVPVATETSLVEVLLRFHKLDAVCKFLTWEELENLARTCKHLTDAILGNDNVISTQILKLKAKEFFRNPHIDIVETPYRELGPMPSLTEKELAKIFASHGSTTQSLLMSYGQSYRFRPDVITTPVETQPAMCIPLARFGKTSNSEVFEARNRLLDACLFAMTHLATSRSFDQDTCRTMVASAALAFATLQDGGRGLQMLIDISDLANKRSGGKFLNSDGLLQQIANAAVFHATVSGCADSLNIVIPAASIAAVSEAMDWRAGHEDTQDNLDCQRSLLDSGKCTQESVKKALLSCVRNPIGREMLIRHARALGVQPRFWNEIVEEARLKPDMAAATKVYRKALRASIEFEDRQRRGGDDSVVDRN